MTLLGPLVLAGIVAAIVFAVQRTRHGAAPPPAVAPSDAVIGIRHPGHSAALSDTLDRWVAADLLSADQAVAILDHERSVAAAPASGRRVKAPAPPRRTPVFAEALGYLGGVLALTGLTLLVANYWPDLAPSIRLALSLATTLALFGAGALVHEHIDPALARLRWFLWTLSSATAAVFTGVLMVDGLDIDTPLFVVAACAGTIALENVLLWRWRDRPIQELLFLAAAIVSASALVGAVTNAGGAGLTAWILAATVLAAGLRGITLRPIIPHVVGTIAIMVGAYVALSQWMGAGLLLVTATVGLLLLLAALPQLTVDLSQRAALLVVAGMGALQGIPLTLVHFAREAGGLTGSVTWAIGGVVMTLGARRLLRAPIVAEIVGGLGLIGGAALTGAQWPSFATLFGLATALTLLGIGTLPGRVLYSLLGSLGLLLNVPWAISRFFPGEGRAPLLILVSGALIIVVAVLLSRQGDRLRTELRPHTPDEASTTAPGDAPPLEHSSSR
ncbi:MAG: DUF2157 domain-containing protein [Acidimicrobiia bacterium]